MSTHVNAAASNHAAKAASNHAVAHQSHAASALPNEKIYPQQWPAAFARTRLESLCALDIDSPSHPHRMANVVCTIGPATQSVEMLEKMMVAGMSIVRMNFSHGTYEYHKQTLDNVRLAASRQPNPIGIALDTKGPEIRTGVMKEGVNAEVEIKSGDPITVTINDDFKEACDKDTLWLDYKNITKVIQPDRRILIDDGNLSLIVKEVVDEQNLKCVVEFGGMLCSKKGCNLPRTVTDLPAIGDKDKEDLIFGVENGIDMIFASFIRSAQNIHDIRQIIGEAGKRVKIISKIETHDGCRRFGEILEASDGIMVARGDLGVEIPTEKVFIAQKNVIARTTRAGKPAICATQMLDSMTKKSRPTRAEAGDVANAILDGADCVMLSGESAKGLFPIQCVEIMGLICREAESAVHHRQLFEELRMLTPKPADITRSTAMAAVEASLNCMAAAIIVLSTTGKSAQWISSYRPRCPIFVVTRDEMTARQLRLCRGIIPLIYTEPKASQWELDIHNRLEFALKIGDERGLIRPNQAIVFVCGSRPGPGTTNSIRILPYVKK